MSLRITEASSSLRARLVLVLAVVLIAPLVTALIVAAALAPRAARQEAQRAAARDAGGAVLALSARCDAVTGAAKVMASEVQGYAIKYGSVSADVAAIAVRHAVARRPDVAVAVFDAHSALLASGGAAAGLAPAREAGYGAACADQQAGSNPDAAGLGAPVPVNTYTASNVALVVVWLPLDDSTLHELRSGLGTDGQLSLLGAGTGIGNSPDGVLATTALAAGPEASGPLPAAARAVTTGAASGVEQGIGYAMHPPADGVPFRVLATYPVAGTSWLQPLVWLALLVLALALLPLRLLAGRLTRPVAVQLEQAQGRLRLSEHTLAETFTSFGDALQHTHDLEELLDIVAAACLRGTGAVAGIALLVEDVPPAPGEPAGEPPAEHLQVRGQAWAHSPTAQRAGVELPRFAARYYTGLDPAAPLPLYAHLSGGGPAVAVSILADGRAIGVLALAKGDGARIFDADALPRIRAVADRAGAAIQNIRLHEEAIRQSVTDPLTGVGNKRQLSSTLFREIERSTRFNRALTVLMLDIDLFKQVNDQFGHGFGDLVLREFAHRLTSCVRDVDVVTRFGGEEFAIVLPETDVEGAGRVAERILNAIRAQPFRHGEQQCSVTVSIGMASFPGPGHSGAEVIQAADEALYQAKRAGRDRWNVVEIAATPSPVSQAG